MNKFDKFINAASSHYKEKILINLSPNEGYRSRCEFGYKNNFYVMHDKGKKVYLHQVSKECQQLIDKSDNLVEVTVIPDLDWHIAHDKLA